jgi:hypothetical protein
MNSLRVSRELRQANGFIPDRRTTNQERPPLCPSVPDRIDSPMKAHTELHVTKRFIGAVGSPMVFRDGFRLHIPVALDCIGWKTVLHQLFPFAR